jgi:hypothetical protein
MKWNEARDEVQVQAHDDGLVEITLAAARSEAGKPQVVAFFREVT